MPGAPRRVEHLVVERLLLVPSALAETEEPEKGKDGGETSDTTDDSTNDSANVYMDQRSQDCALQHLLVEPPLLLPPPAAPELTDAEADDTLLPAESVTVT